MLYRREDVDRKITDLRRLLATTNDDLTVALVKMAIESLESEKDSLPHTTAREQR